jgi:hypothetical protein
MTSALTVGPLVPDKSFPGRAMLLGDEPGSALPSLRLSEVRQLPWPR